MKSEFRNDATMEEKANVLKNDRANASTLHQFASSETGEVGGRWAKPTQVVGTGAPEYPRLPENSPWAQDDLLGPSNQSKIAPSWPMGGQSISRPWTCARALAQPKSKSKKLAPQPLRLQHQMFSLPLMLSPLSR
jgi:hypothetical protein